MSDLTFYTNVYLRGRIVQWMLNECDAIHYDTKLIEFEDIKSLEYLEINPMGKVPALVVKQEEAGKEDIVITEMVAICAYLADAYPSANLAPVSNSHQRGSYYRWLFWSCNVLEPALMLTFGMLSRIETAEAKKALGFGSLKEALNILENELSKKPYLCGDTFSTADLYVTAMIQWALMQGAVKELPNVIAGYIDKISKREALVKIG